MKGLKIKFWILCHNIFATAENFCLKMAIRAKLGPNA